MIDKDRKKVIDLIEGEIKLTIEQIAEYEELSQPIAPDDSIGRVSRMDAINNKSITEAALRTANEKLKSLKYVLTKINDDDFGSCARCGEEIPIKRIILRPQSVYCVRCAR